MTEPIDLDALERQIEAAIMMRDLCDGDDKSQMRLAIAELRAARQVVGFAQWVRDLAIADRQSPQKETYCAVIKYPVDVSDAAKGRAILQGLAYAVIEAIELGASLEAVLDALDDAVIVAEDEAMRSRS